MPQLLNGFLYIYKDMVAFVFYMLLTYLKLHIIIDISSALLADLPDMACLLC